MKHFKYIKPKSNIIIDKPRTYKLANKKEVERLNEYSSLIKDIAKFYEENLSNSKIDYIYKEGNEIKVLPVKYKKENFSHLTGINFNENNWH